MLVLLLLLLLLLLSLELFSKVADTIPPKEEGTGLLSDADNGNRMCFELLN